MKLVDGAWVETPGDSDTMAAWWHYEDHRYQIKEMIACAGRPEEVTMQGVTYDDIDPTIVRAESPPRGHGREPCRGIDLLPQLSTFLWPAVRRAQDRELSRLCVEAYNDWMVDEWCDDSVVGSSRCASCRCGRRTRRRRIRRNADVA